MEAERQFTDRQAVQIAQAPPEKSAAHVIRWYAEVAGNDYYLVSIDGSQDVTRVTCEHDLRTVEVGNAATEITRKMRSRLDDLAVLVAVAQEDWTEKIQKLSSAEFEALGMSGDHAGASAISAQRIEAAEDAQGRLDEYPLCVEATTTFEIVIGTGGPDDRLLIECNVIPPDPGGVHGHYGPRYEISRVLYRYSWEGSAEIVLTGDDRETAEAFARRVVPELVE